MSESAPYVISVRRTRSRCVKIMSNGEREVQARGNVTVHNLSVHNRRRVARRPQVPPPPVQVRPQVRLNERRARLRRTVNARAANSDRVCRTIDLNTTVPKPLQIKSQKMLRK